MGTLVTRVQVEVMKTRYSALIFSLGYLATNLMHLYFNLKSSHAPLIQFNNCLWLYISQLICNINLFFAPAFTSSLHAFITWFSYSSLFFSSWPPCLVYVKYFLHTQLQMFLDVSIMHTSAQNRILMVSSQLISCQTTTVFPDENHQRKSFRVLLS